MGVIKANNVEALIARLPLDSDQIQRGNTVAIVRRILASIRTSNGSDSSIHTILKTAEQHAAALVGIRLFRVHTKDIEAGGIDS